jgi:hypothetical protein
MMIRSSSVRLVLVVLLALGASYRAYACRCVEPSVKSAHRRASMIVLGEALEVVPRPDIQGQEVKVRVLESWKSDSVEIVTIVTGTTCSYPLKTGEKHLLFLIFSEPGHLTTGRCMGDLPLEKAKQSLAWLGKHARRGTVRPASG